MNIILVFMEYKETNLGEEFIKPLLNLTDPPGRLWQYGKLPEKRSTRKVVSIIGSRRCTSYGEHYAYEIAYKLAQKGVIIVSGMAYGVDAAAHRGCLDAGGITVAVLGTPINKLYPRSNEQLAKRIVENGGAIISEYPVGTITERWHFLQRNRIVAALADAVVITEASIHSGTITTAGLAQDQGVDVFAIPGDITRPMSAGCNQLIATNKAQIYTDISDVLIALKLAHGRHQCIDLSDLGEIERKIVKAIQGGVSSGEEIIEKLNISASDFSQNITMLEIKGMVLAQGCNEWILI